MANKLAGLGFEGGWVQRFELPAASQDTLGSVNPFYWYRVDVWGLAFDSPDDASKGLGILADLPFSEGWKNATPDQITKSLSAPPDQIAVLSPPKGGGAVPIVLARYGRFVVRVSARCVACAFDASKPPRVLSEFVSAIDAEKIAALNRSA